jgi:hypothetical protein
LAPRWLKVNFGIKEFVLINVDSSMTKACLLIFGSKVYLLYTLFV